jgi:hypothetical protein
MFGKRALGIILQSNQNQILTVSYEDGAWTKPYYDCGGGNIW